MSVCMRKNDVPFNRARFAKTLICLILLACSALAVAAPRIGVLTMGPGDIFWERFGHDAIVVDDPTQAAPISYNFGYFDPTEPGFVAHFVQGKMRYMLAALPLQQDLAYYRDVGRGVRVQWLDLTPAQANAIAAALADNAKPENAHYRYDYYTSNCSTRVRDVLDQALGGLLKKQLESRSSGDTYRSESLRLASPEPWMWLAFDIALGPYADRVLTRWQQAFLPHWLADALREVRRPDGRPLVASETELLPQRQPAAPPGRAQSLWPWLLAGALIGLGILAVGERQRRWLGALSIGFWLVCGLVGAVLAFAWAGTDHQAIWANRNLLLFNPLCLLLLPGGWALLRKRPPTRVFGGLLIVVAVLAALACLPLWLQVHPQRNGHWVALLLPIHAALAYWWSLQQKP